MRRSTFLAALGAALSSRQLALAAGPRVWLATYAHIDPAWRWPAQEGLEQADSTFRSVLRVLAAYPSLRFSETSAAYYHWIRVTDPATYERVRASVARGAWELCGGWWTEADVNIISGESLMRQAYYGQREFHDHWGATATVSMLPDSFGSSANLPAILQAQGFRYHVTGRGAFANGPLPTGAFMWRSLGDASVIAYNNTVPGGTNDVVATVKAAAALDLGYAPLAWFGLGDHGGGPTIDALRAFDTFLHDPQSPRTGFTRLDRYFAGLPAHPGPAVSGEIEGVFPGAFTNAYRIKRANIDAERALLDCETFDVLAALLHVDSPLPDLEELWHVMLLNQHHDTISGTTLRENLESAVDDDRAVENRAHAIAGSILQRIVDRIAHAPSDDAQIVAFNPLAAPVESVFSYPFRLAPGQMPIVLDANGSRVPVQPAFADGPLYDPIPPATLFPARLPALGYTSFRVTGYEPASQPPPAAVPASLQSDVLTVTLDPRSGLPSALAAAGLSASFGNVRFVTVTDTEDTWGSNGLAAAPIFGTFDVQSTRLLEAGPLRWIVRSMFAFRSSHITVTTEVRARERAVRMTIDATWNEPFMRLALETELPGNQARYDIPYGSVVRAASPAIQCGRSFVARAVAGGIAGIVTCGNHGFWGATNGTGVTLLRNTPYSSLDRVDPGATGFVDAGDHRIQLALVLAHDEAELATFSDALARPFPVLWNGVHEGTLPAHISFARVDPAIHVSSLRRTDATIEARINSRRDVRASGRLEVGPYAGTYDIDPYGIRTLRVRNGQFATIVAR